MEGKRYVHSHCYRADEILMLMRVAKEFGFKVRTFQHVLEGYKVADEIAASGAGGSTFSDWWGYKVEAYDAIPYNAALMTERGVVVSINSDDAEEARQLNQEAAKSMKYGGMTANDALKMITINPAIQLGIDKRVGSIEVGKDADLVIYNHDPLSVYAVAQKTLIDGQVYFDRQKDLAGRAALEKEKQDLLAKEKKAAEEKKDEDKKADDKAGAKPDAKKKPDQKKKPPARRADSGERRCRRCPVNRTPNCFNVTAVRCWVALFFRPRRRPRTRKPAAYAIKGGKVFTLAGAPIENGTVVIRDGKIAAVGANIEIPADAQVIDATGLEVYPGMFDAATQIGLGEISQVSATLDVTELGDYNPELVAATAVNPASAYIPVTRANGITEVIAAPGTAGFRCAGRRTHHRTSLRVQSCRMDDGRHADQSFGRDGHQLAVDSNALLRLRHFQRQGKAVYRREKGIRQIRQRTERLAQPRAPLCPSQGKRFARAV